MKVKSLLQKLRKIFLNTMRKVSPENSVTEKSSKKRTNFTWRHGHALFTQSKN